MDKYIDWVPGLINLDRQKIDINNIYIEEKQVTIDKYK